MINYLNHVCVDSCALFGGRVTSFKSERKKKDRKEVMVEKSRASKG
jgi:hypothetical protein